MKTEPEILREMDKLIWYMTRLNTRPSKKSLGTMFTTGLDKALTTEYVRDNMLVFYSCLQVSFVRFLYHNNDAHVSCQSFSVSLCREFMKVLKWQAVGNKDKVVNKSIFDNVFHHNSFVMSSLEKQGWLTTSLNIYIYIFRD